MLFKQPFTRWLFLITIVLQCGCAQGAKSPLVTSAATEPTLLTEYRFGPDDLVEIHVWKEPDLSREVTVRPDGKISLPLVGDVHAAGFTAEELSAAITQELNGYYKEQPEVSAIVKQVNSSFIYVLGEVESQGKFELRNGTTLLQAIALAGGFNEFASRNKIIVRRKMAGGEEVTLGFRYKDIIAGREKNIELKPGDTIVVP
jgi:polysaccharide export outer membrane protein